MTQGCYVILGANSAIAVATARQLAAKGAALVLVARDTVKLEAQADDLKVRGASRVEVRAMDLVTDIEPAVFYQEVSAEVGDLSGIFVFYGVLGDQSRAEQSLEHALEIIDVNFRSAAAWTLAGASALEASNATDRVLIGISSVAGDRGRRSNYVYGAAKGGYSVLLQGLAHKWGGQANAPRAITMKLGFVDTPMTADVENKGGPLWATPDMIAEVIGQAVERGGPTVYGPWFWRWIMLAIRCTPAFIFNKVNL